MTDNKLYIVLTYFDRIEQNRLRKYICSPYFNANETLMDYFDILIDHINKTEKAEKPKRPVSKLIKSTFTKENTWQKLFKNEPYNDTRFRKLNSELLKLVEGYLAQEIYEQKPLQQINYLFEAVGEKKIETLYTSTERNARLISTQQHLRPADYYYYQYLIEKNYYESLGVDMQRDEKSNVDKIINQLDEFYLAEKIKWYVSMLSRKNLITHDYHLLFIDEIIDYLKKNSAKHGPTVLLNFQILQTLIDSDNEEHYYRLIALLKEHGQLFPTAEQYDFYSGALNYCIHRINIGKSKFLSEFITLFKFMLANKISLNYNSNNLSPWKFNNAVLIALRLGEYEWVEHFITSYKNQLPEDFRENSVSYNLALLYFYQKKYDEVVTLLQSVEYEDRSYNLGSKSMLIAIYYEQDEIEALYALSETFRTYLNRHKDINEKMRLNFINYISFVKKLTKITSGDKKTIEQIRQEIKDAKGVASEKWLLEKLVELE